MRTYVAIEKASLADRVVACLTALPGIEVIPTSEAAKIAASVYRGPSVALFCPSVLRKTMNESHNSRDRISSLPPIILLFEDSNLNNFDLMEYSDGWVFADINLDRLSEIVKLSAAGYRLLPKTVVHNENAGHWCLERLQTLTLLECAILSEIGLGQNRHAISRLFGISRDAIGRLERTIVDKLLLRNSCEAGAMASKYTDEIYRIRRKKIRNISAH